MACQVPLPWFEKDSLLLLEPPWFTLSLLSAPHGGYRVGKAAGRSPGLNGESPRLPQAPCWASGGLVTGLEVAAATVTSCERPFHVVTHRCSESGSPRKTYLGFGTGMNLSEPLLHPLATVPNHSLWNWASVAQIEYPHPLNAESAGSLLRNPVYLGSPRYSPSLMLSLLLSGFDSIPSTLSKMVTHVIMKVTRLFF